MRDWRDSLLPVVCGHLYVALLISGAEFSYELLMHALLFLMSAVGFAATGYVVNEFFDRPTDAHAGKPNRLAHISPGRIILLIGLAVAVALAPWTLLAADALTWMLISAELALFVLYSAPGMRWKDTPLLSNLTDATYAYLIPMLLAFHTVHLSVGEHLPASTWPYAVAMFIAGVRNITVHQVNDLNNDIRTHLRTLPMLLGIGSTSRLLVMMVGSELVLFVTAAMMMSTERPLLAVLPAVLLVVTAYRLLYALPEMRRDNVAFTRVRQLTDHFYQIELPFTALMLLAFQQPMWAVLIPIHLTLFVPEMVFHGLAVKCLAAVQFLRYRILGFAYTSCLRPLLSMVVNRSIWLIIFVLFGTDLRTQGMSAGQFLRKRFPQW